MKRGLLCFALLLAGLGCVNNHTCRDGTIFLTMQFLDSIQVVDGVVMK